MILGWIKYWGTEPLPENLRHPVLKLNIIKIDKNTYTSPAVLYIVEHGKDCVVPDYIYVDGCKESVGLNNEIYSFSIAPDFSMFESQFNTFNKK